MSEQRSTFVSEPISPDAGSGDVEAMGRGEPGAPSGFWWRDRHYVLARVHSSWKSYAMDSGDKYVKRHWFEIETTTGEQMRIYCERHPKGKAARNNPWWVFSVTFSA